MTSSLAESSTKGGGTNSAAAADASASSPSSQEEPATPTRSSVSADHSGDRDPRSNQDDVNEESPLLSPASSNHEQHGFLQSRGRAAPDQDEFQSTKSLWYLIILTISIGGLQIAWSVELSNGSPYLLSLGLSKDLMALVWIAGPLTGTLVQPYVGMLSDNCRVSWGKRKPFMLGGAAATMVSLMVLAWTKDIVGGILHLFGADPASQGVKVTTIVFAVLWVYILDFAINTGKLRDISNDASYNRSQIIQSKLRFVRSLLIVPQPINKKPPIPWPAESRVLAISSATSQAMWICPRSCGGSVIPNSRFYVPLPA